MDDIIRDFVERNIRATSYFCEPSCPSWIDEVTITGVSKRYRGLRSPDKFHGTIEFEWEGDDVPELYRRIAEILKED